MYGLRRRRMTRAQLMRTEMREGLAHLKQAATYAAGGVGSMVGPGMSAAREYARPAAIRDAAATGWATTAAVLAPVAAAARDSARQARRIQAKQMMRMTKEATMSRRRWPRMVTLLAAGTAVGLAGAMVLRRRRRQRWEEYGMAGAEESMMDTARGSFDSAIERAASSVDRALDAAASPVDRAGERAGGAMQRAMETGGNPAPDGRSS